MSWLVTSNHIDLPFWKSIGLQKSTTWGFGSLTPFDPCTCALVHPWPATINVERTLIVYIYCLHCWEANERNAAFPALMTVILCVKERQTDIQGRRGISPEIVNEREKTVSHTKVCVFLFLSKYYSEMSKMPILQRTIVAKLTTVFHPAVFSMYLLYKWECETAVECDLRRTSIFSGYLLMWGLKKKRVDRGK